MEAPVPQYLPPVEPWGRYKEYDYAVMRNYKGRDLFDNVNPLATRELAIFHHNEKWVDRGALKKNVTRPKASMLTWPKRFECSAFWGMMKLLEIDGRAAPGEKTLGNAKAEQTEDAAPPPPTKQSEEVVPPKLDASEVMEKARRKSTSLREGIVMAAMAGPSPAGVDRKDRSGLDAIIFQAASKGKARSAESTEVEDNMPPMPSPRRGLPATPESSMTRRTSDYLVQSLASPQRSSVAINDKDMYAISNLSEKLKLAAPHVDAGLGGGVDPLLEARMHAVVCEKEALKAKLEFAQLEVAKVQAEEAAVKAKLSYAQKEVEMIKSTIDAYNRADLRLRQMLPN